MFLVEGKQLDQKLLERAGRTPSVSKMWVNVSNILVDERNHKSRCEKWAQPSNKAL